MEELLKHAKDFLIEEFFSIFETTIKTVPKLLIALLFFICFYFFAKLARKLARKVFSRLFDNPTVAAAFTGLIYYGIMLAGVFSALSILELSKAVSSLLAGAGIVGLSLSFAFQDLATNLISGLFITIQKPFEIGDLVETNGFVGNVREISLRTVSIEDIDGQIIIIPSKEVFQNPMVNYSSKIWRRINLEVGVSYGEDLKKVKEVSIEALKSVSMVDQSHPILLHFHSFGDSSINFTIRYWINRTDQRSYFDAASAGVMAIKAAYDETDIMIPFPIRTLDFGIKGGEHVKEALLDSVLFQNEGE